MQDLCSIATQKIISSHVSTLGFISIIILKILSLWYPRPAFDFRLYRTSSFSLSPEKRYTKYLRTCVPQLLRDCSEITSNNTENMV